MRGKVLTQEIGDGSYPDHPRLCGEKLHVISLVSFIPGSPPPMRGKALVPVQTSPILRITPAYAGKRFFPANCRTQRRDHPRLCGEKLNPYQKEAERKGSPPPMRGKGHEITSLTTTHRITPAYAGKSALQSPQNPRSSGSPPPMRGKV